MGEPGADAGLQKAKADASEECVAPEGNTATIRAGAVAAPKRKVGSGAEVPPAKAVARLGALSTSPADRPEAAEAAVAVAAVRWRRRRRMVPGCLLRRRGSGGWTSAPRCHRLSAYGLLWGAGLWAAAAAAEGGEAGEAGGRAGTSEARGETTGDDGGDDDERRLSYRGREHR